MKASKPVQIRRFYWHFKNSVYSLYFGAFVGAIEFLGGGNGGVAEIAEMRGPAAVHIHVFGPLSPASIALFWLAVARARIDCLWRGGRGGANNEFSRKPEFLTANLFSFNVHSKSTWRRRVGWWGGGEYWPYDPSTRYYSAYIEGAGVDCFSFVFFIIHAPAPFLLKIRNPRNQRAR